jgi:DNA helicase HerA-like ATPase
MSNEDLSEFGQFAEGFREEHTPVGETESFLVERIIGLAWRLRRAGCIEIEILDAKKKVVDFRIRTGFENRLEHLEDRSRIKRAVENDSALLAMVHESIEANVGLPPEVFLKLEEVRNKNRALDEALKRQKNVATATANSGDAFILDSKHENALAKLSRYETSLERSFYKGLHELQRMQAARHGKEVPLPVAIDLDISGVETLTK